MQNVDYRKNAPPPKGGQQIIRLMVTGFWLMMALVAGCILMMGAGVLAGLFWKAFQWTLAQ